MSALDTVEALGSLDPIDAALWHLVLLGILTATKDDEGEWVFRIAPEAAQS